MIDDVNFEQIIQENLQEINGLTVRVDYTGSHETSTPTVWITESEIDLSEADKSPRRYECKQKMGLVVVAKTNLKEWVKKVFKKIENKRINNVWEDVRVNRIKRAIDGVNEYYYVEIEIMYNLIVEYSAHGGEAIIESKIT